MFGSFFRKAVPQNTGSTMDPAPHLSNCHEPEFGAYLDAPACTMGDFNARQKRIFMSIGLA